MLPSGHHVRFLGAPHGARPRHTPPTRRSLCGPSKALALGRAGPTTLHRRPRACGESTPLPFAPPLRGAQCAVELLALRRLGPIQGKPPEVLGLLARAQRSPLFRGRRSRARRADLPPHECFLKKNPPRTKRRLPNARSFSRRTSRQKNSRPRSGAAARCRWRRKARALKAPPPTPSARAAAQ